MSVNNKNDTKFFFFFSTPKIAKLRLIVTTIGIIVFLSIVISNPNLNTNAQLQQQDQSNINAANVYQTQTMVLGNNIKNLVILIPNEAHEPPNLKPKELRVVNQPYLPENAVVNVGTTVTWFNADVKHPHKITLVDNKSKNIVLESDTFEYFTASKPIKFNNTGIFTYSGPSFDRVFPKYIMNGTLTVVNQPVTTSYSNTTAAKATSAATANNENNIDTITTLMVPAKLLDKVISELKDQGFGIDNQYTFKSLRGGGSAAGGDKQQVLLVLTSSGKNLNEVVSALSKISPIMPYS
jgi:plastocyanin